MDNIAERLDSINQTLEKQNDILHNMLDIMPRPAGKITSILETIVLIIGVSGVVSIADIILRWIKGG